MSSPVVSTLINTFTYLTFTQIDLLKMRTYGVKKPLEEKEEKIQKLLEENKRYYPTTKNGK